MNDAITKIETSTEPINPINFNSVPSEFILTELTELTELTVVEVTFVEVDTSWLESVAIDSFVIIEFLNLSLALNLFFLEFFFATIPLLIS
mgnify:FL=1|tara:strand:- start:1403 stop:1675 length:273 start_codon:yes stop_codon:yes gene_type:complete